MVSSVSKIGFVTQPPSFFSLEDMVLESQFLPVVRILDKDSKKKDEKYLKFIFKFKRSANFW